VYFGLRSPRVSYALNREDGIHKSLSRWFFPQSQRPFVIYGLRLPEFRSQLYS